MSLEDWKEFCAYACKDDYQFNQFNRDEKVSQDRQIY